MKRNSKNELNDLAKSAKLISNINTIRRIFMKVETRNAEDKKLVSSVFRTMVIIEKLASGKDLSLDKISKELSLPKSTVYRFLQTLVEMGYVRQNDNGQYTLTFKLLSIGASIAEHNSLIGEARAVMAELSAKTKETIHLSQMVNNKAVYIEKIEARHIIRMYSKIGAVAPLYCTGVGKVILAFQEKDERKKLMNSLVLKRITENTIIKKEELKKEIKKIRVNGWAEDNEEGEYGLWCAAAPIFDYTCSIAASISITVPVYRLKSEKKGEYINFAVHGAAEISKNLGYIKQ